MAFQLNNLRRSPFLDFSSLSWIFIGLGSCVLYGSIRDYGTCRIFFVMFSAMAVLPASLVSFYLAGTEPSGPAQDDSFPAGYWIFLPGGWCRSLLESRFFAVNLIMWKNRKICLILLIFVDIII